MFNNINPEYFTLFFTILGSICTFFSLIWLKVIIPILKLINGHENTVKTIAYIKAELTTNGGNSIKDTVIDLRKICGRIETRQKIIEQRTRAALHYTDAILFETDKDGRVTWTNANFCKFFSTNQTLEGYDWLTVISEDEREEVFQEFNSCLNMNRKFNHTAKTIDGREIRMSGYPYKITEVEQGGFLVSILETQEV